jgi:hypothetical protein
VGKLCKRFWINKKSRKDFKIAELMQDKIAFYVDAGIIAWYKN